MVKWQDYIVSDQKVRLDKPVIKGTRISVEFVLERLADGWTEEQILENYPRLNKDSIKAIFAYAYDCMKDGLLYTKTRNRA